MGFTWIHPFRSSQFPKASILLGSGWRIVMGMSPGNLQHSRPAQYAAATHLGDRFSVDHKDRRSSEEKLRNQLHRVS